MPALKAKNNEWEYIRIVIPSSLVRAQHDSWHGFVIFDKQKYSKQVIELFNNRTYKDRNIIGVLVRKVKIGG